MSSNETDARPVGTDDAARADGARTAGTLAAALLVLAFVGAATAGVLQSVGPYLLGVSALAGVLLALSRR
ncbi:hypothetical protein [Halorussus lipolyticus]|uniref:hypothetical protein n=1 Tax=Halorussus lipolyticus TaxID=3034024 RepID=UPI0023E8091D|nr:hypothetical protein [Halorussus sp. DT80]